MAGNAAVRGLSGNASAVSSLTNFGLLEGGNGAAAISEDGSTWNVALVNSGTIRAGTGQSNAIVFGQNAASTSVLELQAGSIIQGNVIASALGANDTLRLGGATNASFDVSSIGATAQYRNFDTFQKSGTSTWTLTGAGTAVTNWNIQQGTLQVGDGTATGSIIGNVTDNGVLAFNRSDASTFNGVISGAGSVTQVGGGTLILTGANTYGGGTTISAGTLQLGGGTATGSIIGNVIDNGILAFNRSDTSTFNGSISGTGSVTQLGGGTTILTGANTYSGGTAINGGVLRVSSDANLGAGAGALSFNGGALQTTADISSARAVSLVGAGGFITDAGTTLTLSTAVSGAGSLAKDGAGTLALAADNSYTGGTSINAGVLQVGAGGTAGSISGGDVLDNATLAFNRSNMLAVAAAISGTGAVDQIGSGTTILTANNSYTGGTTIDAGTLQLGNGGTSGSVTGAVTNNATLAINRSDTFTVAAAISGTGAVNQIGSGTTILTADNTYTGGTTIAAGTLQVGDGGTLGSLTGDVTNNGTLVFNRADALPFAGVITGSGILRQGGAGMTTLSAAGSNASTLDVQQGTLEVASGASLSAATTNVAAGATLTQQRYVYGHHEQ